MRKLSRGSRPWDRARKDRGSRIAEGLFESAGKGPLSIWRDGVVLALLPALYGLFPLISGHVYLGGRGRGGAVELHGGQARAVGVAAIALGIAIHVHFFWGAHETLSEYHGRGLLGAALLFFGALAYLGYPFLG
jgi:hypothetical protein